jgi:hypothetical protein
MEVTVAIHATHDLIEMNLLQPGAFRRLAKMELLAYVLKREQVVWAARHLCMNLPHEHVAAGRVEKT